MDGMIARELPASRGLGQPKPNPAEAAQAAAPPPAPSRRGRKLLLLAAAAAVAGAAWYGTLWWTTGRFMQATDDSYVGSDSVGIASRIAGQVAEVLVADNQVVSAGDVLARLDPRDLQVALQSAQADLAAAKADAAALDAQITLQASTIAAAQADVLTAQAAARFARDEAARYAELMRTGAGSQQRAQSTQADIAAREAGLARALASVEAARQQTSVLAAQRQRAEAAIARASAAVAQAGLNLSYASIIAPVAGTVGDRQIRKGQWLTPGQRALTVVPLGPALYITANFKETQLACMRPGQPASVEVDALGGRSFPAKLDSVAPGSGAVFALLPPENATGNFTKIVQRVPVRLVLEPGDGIDLLRPGLSVTATVDTRAVCKR